MVRLRLLASTALVALIPFLTQATAARVPHRGVVSPFSSSKSAYDDSRIQDYPDKKLLRYIRTYFEAFVGADFEKIAKLQAPEYTMTDIPLGTVQAPRSAWNEINAGFTNLLSDLAVESLSLYGSSEPGSFSVMEHLVRFKLKTELPPGAAEHLPAGAKKGDSLGMINVSIIWWTKDGTMTQEWEYGRIAWKEFSTDPWNANAQPMCSSLFHQGLRA